MQLLNALLSYQLMNVLSSHLLITGEITVNLHLFLVDQLGLSFQQGLEVPVEK